MSNITGIIVIQWLYGDQTYHISDLICTWRDAKTCEVGMDTFIKKGFNCWTEWDNLTKFSTPKYGLSLWSFEKGCSDWTLGGIIKWWETPPRKWQYLCNHQSDWLVQGAVIVNEDIRVSLKIRPLSANEVWAAIRQGYWRPIGTKTRWSCLTHGSRGLWEAWKKSATGGEGGRLCVFQVRKGLFITQCPRQSYHMVELILNNFASRTAAVNQIVS